MTARKTAAAIVAAIKAGDNEKASRLYDQYVYLSEDGDPRFASIPLRQQKARRKSLDKLLDSMGVSHDIVPPTSSKPGGIEWTVGGATMNAKVIARQLHARGEKALARSLVKAAGMLPLPSLDELRYDPAKLEGTSLEKELGDLKTIEQNKVYGPAETKLLRELRSAVEKGDKRKGQAALKKIERTAPSLSYLLGPSIHQVLARVVTAAGAAFVVEIKSKPPRFIIGPDGERITADEMINMLRGYFLSEKLLKNRMAIMDFSTRGKWPAVYIDSSNDSELAANDAEDEVMRLIREAADYYPELAQWTDKIRDRDLELGYL